MPAEVDDNQKERKPLRIELRGFGLRRIWIVLDAEGNELIRAKSEEAAKEFVALRWSP